MSRKSQTALERYKARRGESSKKAAAAKAKAEKSAGGLSPVAQWKIVRLLVLLLLLAGAAWPLLPRSEHSLELTYEIDLEQAPEGTLVITLLAEGKLPSKLDLEFPPGVFGDDNGVSISAPIAHAVNEDGSKSRHLIIDPTPDGWRIQTDGARRIGFIYRAELMGSNALETDIRRHISTPVKGGVRAAGFEIFLEPVGVEVEDLTVTVHNPLQLPILVPWPALVRNGAEAVTTEPKNEAAGPVQDAHLGFGEGYQPALGEGQKSRPRDPQDQSKPASPVPANLFYHPLDLADLNNSLIICGNIRTLSDQARDCVIQYATDRDWYFEDERVLNLVRSVARAEIGFFGSAPSDQITVLLAANEVFSPEGFDVYGVHTGNSVLVMIDPQTTWGVLQEQAASVIAHEMFHGWLGEAIKQVDPETLWFTEGATTWYSARILAAAGVWELDHSREIIRRRLERDYAGSDLMGTISIAEAASQVMAQRDVVSYGYAGATAACMALDDFIASKSGQKAPLDQVLRHLYQTRDEEGLSRAKLEEAVLTICQVDCHQWLDTFVYGTQPLDPVAEQLAAR